MRGASCRPPRTGPGPAAGRWWLRRRSASVLIEPRVVLVGVLLLIGIVCLGILALRVGSFALEWGEILQALRGRGGRATTLVVTRWRAPRILLAIGAGAALAAAGQAFQVVTRNPLGSPDLIGFSTGAQTGILLAVLVLPVNMVAVSLASLLGGGFAGAAVLVLSRRGGFGGLRLVLGGIAISSMLESLNRWLIVRVDSDTAFGALRAVTGTLAAARWSVTLPALVGIAAVLVPMTRLDRSCRVLLLGQDVAVGLGVNATGVRLALVMGGTLLVALVTMAAGPIGFVALIAPHLARGLAGRAVPPLILTAATGALLLLMSDIATQAVLESLPVGVATSAVGGAYLMVVLTVAARSRKVLR